jgi:cell division protein FtsL
MKSQKNNRRNSSKNRQILRKKTNGFWSSKVVRNILLALIVFFIIAGSAILYVYFSYLDDVLSVQKVNATINVDDFIGFNLDKDALHFGTAFPGGKSMRQLNIMSSEKGYLFLASNSQISDWIFVSSQNVPVENGIYNKFDVIIAVPSNVPYGNYTFELDIYILEKKADFLTNLLLKTKPLQVFDDNKELGSAKVSVDIVNTTSE